MKCILDGHAIAGAHANGECSRQCCKLLSSPMRVCSIGVSIFKVFFLASVVDEVEDYPIDESLDVPQEI